MTAQHPDRSDDPALARLAARYVWWQPIDETLREPVTLLWSVLSIGTADDYVAVRDRFGEPALIDALRRAKPGAIDDRSWWFWHRHFRLPVPPPPRRRFE